MTVFVLWENHAVGPIHKFGPHVFLVACVAAKFAVDRHDLVRSRTIGGRPCSGNANVLLQLRDDQLWDNPEHIVAVLDGDKLHDLLGLTGDDALRLVPADRRPQWLRDRDGQVRKHAGGQGADQLSVCILDRNLESLLEILDSTLRKEVFVRDKILQRAAADPGLIRKAMSEMPTWAALVEAVAGRLQLP